MSRFKKPTSEDPFYRFNDDYTPLQKADFNPPPQSMTGDKTPRTIWEGVGKALSRWSIVEHELSRTFHILMQSKTGASWRAIGSLISVQSQIEMVLGAAEQCFQPKSNKQLATVRRMVNIMKKASERRNEFAHGHVTKFHSHGHFLVPSQHDRRKVNLEALVPESLSYCYTSADIRVISDKLRYLDREMFNMNADLLKAIHARYPLTRPGSDPQHLLVRSRQGTSRPKRQPPHALARG